MEAVRQLFSRHPRTSALHPIRKSRGKITVTAGAKMILFGYSNRRYQERREGELRREARLHPYTRCYASSRNLANPQGPRHNNSCTKGRVEKRLTGEESSKFRGTWSTLFLTPFVPEMSVVHSITCPTRCNGGQKRRQKRRFLAAIVHFAVSHHMAGHMT